jgi:hypothetical protein
MKKATRKPTIRDEYPDHPYRCPVEGKALRRRGGCKVYWMVFADKATAEECRKWALVEADIRERQGYDAGYCSPGSIRQVEDGYEVCIL